MSGHPVLHLVVLERSQEVDSAITRLPDMVATLVLGRIHNSDHALISSVRVSLMRNKLMNRVCSSVVVLP